MTIALELSTFIAVVLIIFILGGMFGGFLKGIDTDISEMKHDNKP